jgi:hypothetical protein
MMMAAERKHFTSVGSNFVFLGSIQLFGFWPLTCSVFGVACI